MSKREIFEILICPLILLISGILGIIMNENLLFDDDSIFTLSIAFLSVSFGVLGIIVAIILYQMEIIKKGFQAMYNQGAGRITITNKTKVTPQLLQQIEDLIEGPRRAKDYLDNQLSVLKSRINPLTISLTIIIATSFILIFYIKSGLEIKFTQSYDNIMFLNITTIFLISLFIYSLILLLYEMSKLLRLSVNSN